MSAVRGSLVVGLMRAIEAHGTPVCLWRWCDLGAEDGDVDMAFGGSARRALRSVHAACGELGYRVVNVIPYATRALAVAVEVGEGADGRPELLKIDLAADLCMAGVSWVRGDRAIAGRYERDGVYVAATDDSFAYYFAKRLLKRDVRPQHLAELAGYLSDEPSAADVVREWLGPDHAEDVLAWIRDGGTGEVAPPLPVVELAAVMRRRAIRRRPLAFVAQGWANAARLANRQVRPVGRCIAVLGVDGSGKSTALASLFAERVSPFSGIEFGHFRPDLLSGRSHDPAEYERPHDVAPYPTLLGGAKLAYLWLDYVIGYLVRVRPRLARGYLVVFDRYALDVAADPARYRLALPSSLVRAVMRLTPQPAAYVLLDLDTEAALARKAEVHPALLASLAERYRSLASEARVTVVDAGATPAAVAAALERAIVAVTCEASR